MTSYQSQNETLNRVFGVLPQTTYALIVALRLIVAVPLFMWEMKELAFFGAQWLVVVMAATVVLALEVIGFIASVMTAYFRSIHLDAGFWVALSIALFIGGFNAWLLLHIEGFAISQSTQILFQVFNIMSVLLGEATGFLVVSLKQDVFQIETNETNDETQEETLSLEEEQMIRSGKPSRDDVMALRAESKSFREIATHFGVSPATISRIINS